MTRRCRGSVATHPSLPFFSCPHHHPWQHLYFSENRMAIYYHLKNFSFGYVHDLYISYCPLRYPSQDLAPSAEFFPLSCDFLFSVSSSIILSISNQFYPRNLSYFQLSFISESSPCWTSSDLSGRVACSMKLCLWIWWDLGFSTLACRENSKMDEKRSCPMEISAHIQCRLFSSSGLTSSTSYLLLFSSSCETIEVMQLQGCPLHKISRGISLQWAATFTMATIFHNILWYYELPLHTCSPPFVTYKSQPFLMRLC